MPTAAKLVRVSRFLESRLPGCATAGSARRQARLAQSGIQEKRFGAGSSFESRIERGERMRRSFRERKVRSIIGGETMFARQFELRDRTSVATIRQEFDVNRELNHARVRCNSVDDATLRSNARSTFAISQCQMPGTIAASDPNACRAKSAYSLFSSSAIHAIVTLASITRINGGLRPLTLAPSTQ
jgi:hypothetical protein